MASVSVLQLMTSIAHRVEEDIQRLAERMGVSGQKCSEPTQQQQHAPQTNSAAAAPLAGLSQLAHGDVDLQLLHELADSGSITTPSDTDVSHEADTAHNSGSKRPLQEQQQQACSQQAHLQEDDSEAGESESAAKRRRLSDATVAEAAVEGCRPVIESTADANAAGIAAEAAAVTDVHHTQEPEAAAPAAQQQQAVPLLTLRRCSSTGCNADSEQQQQQQPQHAERLAAVQQHTSLAGCSSAARQGSIMRQTQVALTTWRHLQSTASTPSTVMPNSRLLHRSATACTESSAV